MICRTSFYITVSGVDDMKWIDCFSTTFEI